MLSWLTEARSLLLRALACWQKTCWLFALEPCLTRYVILLSAEMWH